MVMDTQSVHLAARAPASTRGHDPAKRVPGSKRGLAVDALGMVITAVILAANAYDNTAGTLLLDQVAEHAGGSVRRALAHRSYKTRSSCTVPASASMSRRRMQSAGQGGSCCGRSGGESSRPTES